MYLEQRFTPFQPPQFNLATSTILGTTATWPIDRTWPIEEIIIQVGFTVTTALVWTVPANAASGDNLDNILNLVQKINLQINDRNQPRSVVDISGVGLLEHVAQSGFNQDPGTMDLVGYSQSTGLPVGQYLLTYRLPMVNPMIGEPLRSRMYLPVHKFLQDPVLRLTFNTLANLGVTAGVVGNVYTDVVLVRRLPTASSETELATKNDPGNPNPYGYIDFDIIETPYSVAPGVGAEQRLALPIPGNYISLCARQYLGGAPMTRNVLDGNGIGDTVAHGFGNENYWRLESGGVVIRNWRWKHLRTVNDWDRPNCSNPRAQFVAAASAGAVTTAFNASPNFGGNVLATTNFRPASSVQLNFLNDGFSGETGNELGSLLDCNVPANTGLKMEIIGTPASVATNASYLYIVGHRLFGSISRWQKF